MARWPLSVAPSFQIPARASSYAPSAGCGGLLCFLYAEDQAAADPVGLDEAHQHLRAEPVDPAGIAPDQSPGCLVADIIVARQGRYRDQPVGAIFPQFHEQPETRDPADVGVEEAADRSGEKGRPVALDGGALGVGGTPFGCRDVYRNRFELVTAGFR